VRYVNISTFDKSLFKLIRSNVTTNHLKITDFDRNLNEFSNGYFISNSIIFDASQSNININSSTFEGITTNYSATIIYNDNLLQAER